MLLLLLLLLLLSNSRRLGKWAENRARRGTLYIANHPPVPALIHCIANARHVQLVLPCSQHRYRMISSLGISPGSPKFTLSREPGPLPVSWAGIPLILHFLAFPHPSTVSHVIFFFFLLKMKDNRSPLVGSGNICSHEVSRGAIKVCIDARAAVRSPQRTKLSARVLLR